MKLKSDEPLSNFAFNLNLRRYIKLKDLMLSAHHWKDPKVGRTMLNCFQTRVESA